MTIDKSICKLLFIKKYYFMSVEMVIGPIQIAS